MRFAELVDITELQELCQSFTETTGAVTAILELNGEILSATGWKGICTKFHRGNPETSQRCLESDTILAGQLKKGSLYNLYQCKNGLYDAAIPIIINGVHVANFFTGQFLLKEPDIEFFKRQAKKFGFNTDEYLKALSEVPIYSQAQITSMLDFFSRLARIMGETGLARNELEHANTELKKHQEHLVDLVRERTVDLNRAQEIARMGSWKWDITTDKVFWSDNMYLIFGYEIGNPKEITHEFFLECIHPDDRNQIADSLKAMIIQKTSFRDEFRIITKQNNEKIFRVYGEVRLDSDGNPIELFGTNLDITEEKRNETILLEAKKRAEEANLAKVQFLSRMSHELRTPLNAILGYSQLLKNHSNLTDTQKNQILTIKKSGEHLLELINEILEVSRIEQKKITIETKPFNIHDLVKGILELSEVKAQEKDLLLSYEEISQIPDFLIGDERRIKEVLINLVSNAIKYTHDGMVTLKIGYSHDHEGIFTGEVIDTGVGIDPEEIDMIFLPFTQLAGEVSSADGAGLGLTIVKQLLDLMGGTIEVDSVPGKGSRFYFTIPLPDYTGVIGAKPVVPEISGYKGPLKEILIVDDNAINASFLVSALKPLGFITHTADNGTTALTLIKKIHPDLLLLDLVMPGMNGLEVTRAIRKERAFDDIKIIGISATVTDSILKDEFIENCNDFLTKPVNLSLFYTKIQKSLNIEWILKNLPENKEKRAVIDEYERLPPVSYITRIRNAIELGDFTLVEDILKELDMMSEDYTRFIQKIRDLSLQYDDEGILTMMDETLLTKDGQQD